MFSWRWLRIVLDKFLTVWELSLDILEVALDILRVAVDILGIAVDILEVAVNNFRNSSGSFRNSSRYFWNSPGYFRNSSGPLSDKEAYATPKSYKLILHHGTCTASSGLVIQKNRTSSDVLWCTTEFIAKVGQNLSSLPTCLIIPQIAWLKLRTFWHLCHRLGSFPHEEHGNVKDTMSLCTTWSQMFFLNFVEKKRKDLNDTTIRLPHHGKHTCLDRCDLPKL